VDDRLGLLRAQLILRDDIKLLVDHGGLLPLGVENGLALVDLAEAPNDGGVDEADRFISVCVINARDQNCLRLLLQVLLNNPNALIVGDVLIVLGVDSHLFGPHREPLLVLLLIVNVDDKGDARGVLLHQGSHVVHS